MRGSLLRTFDKIYIVNLHGSANKKETTPEGGKDENIFNIMQGIALFIGVKKTIRTDWAKVYYADVWGTREAKLDSLAKGNLSFSELKIDRKMAYFIPFGSEDKEEYDKGVSLAELFPTNVTGIASGNDEAAIALTKTELIRRMEIVKSAVGEEEICNLWKHFTQGRPLKRFEMMCCWKGWQPRFRFVRLIPAGHIIQAIPVAGFFDLVKRAPWDICWQNRPARSEQILVLFSTKRPEDFFTICFDEYHCAPSLFCVVRNYIYCTSLSAFRVRNNRRRLESQFK